ncbi:MAG: hypothetical protein ACOC8K_01685 [Gemmatimonadota bacterium]
MTGMGRGTRLPRRIGRRHGAVFVLALTLAGVSWGCAGFSTGPSVGPTDSGSRLAEGKAALDEGRYGEAYGIFQELASSCEAGEEGSDAILLLATAELDPRNPARFPTGTAHLAARYLQVSPLTVTARAVAESLYLLALDLGARPVEDPYSPIPTNPAMAMDAPLATDAPSQTAESAARDASPEEWSVAPGFRDCSSPEERDVVDRELPTLSGPSLDATIEALLGERDIARSAADSLSTELERIRGLLRSGIPDPDSGMDRR